VQELWATELSSLYRASTRCPMRRPASGMARPFHVETGRVGGPLGRAVLRSLKMLLGGSLRVRPRSVIRGRAVCGTAQTGRPFSALGFEPGYGVVLHLGGDVEA
jgi:hypothetical protein